MKSFTFVDLFAGIVGFDDMRGTLFFEDFAFSKPI